MAAGILVLLFLTAANTYFSWNIGLPRFPLCTGPCLANNYPTNPFYNPSAGVTTMGRIYHSGGPLVRESVVDNINCILQSNGATDVVLTPQNTCLYQVFGSGGSTPGLLTLPVGMYGDNVNVPFTICTPFVGCTTYPSSLNYGISLPSTITQTCVGFTISGPCQDGSGFDLKTGLSGTPILLDPTTCSVNTGQCTGDPTCSNWSVGGVSADSGNTKNGNCWTSDLQIIQSAQLRNPPCRVGVTVCIYNSPRVGNVQNITLTNPVNGTTTFVNPNTNQLVTYQSYTYTPANCPNKSGAILSNGNCLVTVQLYPVSQKVWYLYRMITSLQLGIVPPTTEPVCLQGNGANYCSPGSGTPSCPALSTCTFNPTGTLQSFAATAVGNINKVDILTNSQIGFGISVPGTAALTCSTNDIASGNCWWGIIGLWIGGQDLQTAGCSASSSTCSFAAGTSGPHTQLPIFSCPQMVQSCSATVPLPNIITGIATISNQTTAQVISSQVYPQIYSYITTANFGPTYACQGGTNCPTCTQGSLSTCLTSPTNLAVNVPLVFDVLGTQQLANWLYQYPGIPPSGGPSTANIFGRITDVNGNPIAGACVTVGTGICSFAPGQPQRTTGPDGRYSFATANLPAGVYGVYASAPGYVSGFETPVALSVGANVQVDLSLTLIPLPPSQTCLIPPVQIPNINPFAPPTYTPGILCIPPIPGYVLPAILILTGLGLVALIFISPAGSAATIYGVGLLSTLRRRR